MGFALLTKQTAIVSFPLLFSRRTKSEETGLTCDDEAGLRTQGPPPKGPETLITGEEGGLSQISHCIVKSRSHEFSRPRSFWESATSARMEIIRGTQKGGDSHGFNYRIIMGLLS